jgi:hypothetical protein
LDIDKKYDFESRFGNSKAKAAPAPVQKASDPDADFKKFLEDSDDSDVGAKPVVSNVLGGARLQASTKVDDNDSDVSDSQDSAHVVNKGASTVVPVQRNQADVLDDGGVSEVSSDHNRGRQNLSPSDSRESIPRNAPRKIASSPASRSLSEGSRAPSPRIGFGQKASPLSSRHNSRSPSRSSGKSRASSTHSLDGYEVVQKPTGTLPASSVPVPARSVADLMAQVEAEVDEEESSAEAAPEQHVATATYTEDFESTVQGLGSIEKATKESVTYMDDFEEDASDFKSPQGASVRADVSSSGQHLPAKSNSASASSTHVLASSSNLGTAQPLITNTSSSKGISVTQASVSKLRECDDDDYRPRRPTCHVGIQANIPVDVGVQCDPPPQDPRAPDDPFMAWMRMHSSLHSPPVAAAGFPAMPMYGVPPFVGTGPYAQWGGCGGYPMAYPQPLPPGPPAAAQSAMLQQFFKSAVAGPFAPPSRTETTADGQTPGEDARSATAAVPVNSGASQVSPFSVPYTYGYNAPGPATAMSYASGFAANGGVSPATLASGIAPMSAPGFVAHGGMSPATLAPSIPLMPGPGFATNGGVSPAALAALSVVDDSYRQQIELLKKAAAIHKTRLDKARGPQSVNVSPAPSTAFAAPVRAADVEQMQSSPTYEAD